MSEKNITLKKSFSFAVRIDKLCRYLNKEHILPKQLLRSGTSIGANINKVSAAQSKKDFIAEMSIAHKEARETQYWTNLLAATGYLNSNEKHTASLIDENKELIGLLSSIIKTSQESLSNAAN
ncbi:MAG: four helix bundle protein [Hydrogenimonas sp.]|nr:four helix bundle protein [Hydrogenimonas sp.]